MSTEEKTATDVHALDRDLIKTILKFGRGRFPDAGSPEDAFEELLGGDPEDLPFFVPWMAYHWRIQGRPLAKWFLEERASKLSPTERTWLEAQSKAWLSIWEVTDVKSGVSLVLTDLLAGERRFVREKSASRGLSRGEVVLGRIVDFGGVSVIAGMRAYPLPPDRVPGLLVHACEALGFSLGQVPIDRLHEQDSMAILVSLWEEEVDELKNAGPPQLTNTDGDELILTTDTFGITSGSTDAIVERLSALEGVERDENEKDQPVLVFTRAGNAMMKASGPTVIGRVRLAGQALTIETNSTRRADNLRALVEEKCAGLLRYDGRDRKDTESFWKESRSSRKAPAEPPSPEAAKFVREYKAKHYEAWLDESIPALGGATPREAAKNPLGREMLLQLLKEMEHMESKLPKTERYDYSILRRRLGLA